MAVTMIPTLLERPLQSILLALSLLAFIYLARLLTRAYKIRARLHNQLGPGPHSWLWGHLKAVGAAVAAQPAQFHPHAMCLQLKKAHNITSRYFYLDLWPMGDPIFYVYDAAIAAQVTTEFQTPKYYNMKSFMLHISGPGDMVSSDGAQWKKWRSVFNPGFAAGHLMGLVPMVVEESEVFVGKMREFAGAGRVFRMEENATRLTVDIIGRMALDTTLGTQKGEDEMVTALRDQVQRLPNDFMNPFAMYTPTGIWKRWRNDRVMNRYIGNLLEERFSQRTAAAAAAQNSKSGDEKKRPRARAIIDLALETYLQEVKGEAEDSKTPSKMDADLKAQACVHIRTFLFAGHDTTSSTIAYALYLLQKHPSALQTLRAEHDKILGPLATTAETISQNPHILNKLEYTLAVTKEVLRLFPAASTVRSGAPDFFIRDPETGELLPTEGTMIWVVHHAMHRDPAVWGEDALEFRPERFLPANAASLPEGNWRPFEKGSRNCIGQDLALIETKVILALVVRAFDFEPAYDAVEELKGDGSYWSASKWRAGAKNADGEEAYQVLCGSAKPSQGMPMRVKLVE